MSKNTSLNISGRGIGVSMGPKGAKTSVGPRGIYAYGAKGPLRYRGSLVSSMQKKGKSQYQANNEAQDALQALAFIIITIVVTAILLGLLGFSWWILCGVPALCFFVYAMILGSAQKTTEGTLEKEKDQQGNSMSYQQRPFVDVGGKTKLDRQVNRNLIGKELENEGRMDDAIPLYEQNITERFDGSHPYTRLAIIYKKKGFVDDEIRVIGKAMKVLKDPKNQHSFGKRLVSAVNRKEKDKIN